MPASAQYTTDDLHRKVAQLLMECDVRGKREDSLTALVKQLQEKIAELEKPRVETVPIKKKAVSG
jgi:uncharacterized membrane protein